MPRKPDARGVSGPPARAPAAVMQRSSPARILVVEDDPGIARALALNLQEEGYRVTVAARGDEGLTLALRESFQLLILDLMLPGTSGKEICSLVRERSRVPILILTARTSEGDRVAGLDLGADDYVTKPFGMLELLARVRALLRRAGESPEPAAGEVYTAGGVSMDVDRHRVTCDGVELSLRPKQFELLRVLLANRGRVMTRDRLLELVWGDSDFLDTGTLDVHIRWLRQQLERDPSRPARIQTVRGVGYRYSEDAP